MGDELLVQQLGREHAHERHVVGIGELAIALAADLAPQSLGGRGLDVAEPDHHRAHGGGADERPQVDGCAEPPEVARQVAPVGPDSVAVVERLHLLEKPRRGRGDRLALAGDLGGDALADLRLHPVVGEQEALRLAEQVDEPRRHHAVAQLDAPPRL